MGVSLTEREMDIMAVLWEQGSATVSEVREALDDDDWRVVLGAAVSLGSIQDREAIP